MKTTDLSPECIILVGLPATGKSTYIKQLLADHPEKNYVVISTDDVMMDLAAEEGLSYADAFEKYIGQADKKAKINFRQAKNARANIVIDRTNLTQHGRRKFLSQLPKEYHTKAVVFEVSKDELARRTTKREIEIGKRVPPDVVERMIRSYAPPTTSEFDEVVYV